MIVQLRSVFCPLVQCLSFFSEVFSWTILDSSSFPLCGQVVKSFTSWYALLLLFLLRFYAISLHCSPIQFLCVCLFHASLDVVVHLLVLLRSFKFESFHSVIRNVNCMQCQLFAMLIKSNISRMECRSYAMSTICFVSCMHCQAYAMSVTCSVTRMQCQLYGRCQSHAV